MFNILITDDEQIVIDSLSFIINKNFSEDVNIFTALSGTEAIEIVTKENIDILFMDINMPGLNGLETVNVITKIKPNIVFIILSAFDSFQYAQEAITLGAYKYITKPVNRNVVIETIRSSMQLVEQRKGRQNDEAELHKKIDLVSPMIENDFIYACIFNNDSSVELSSYLEYFNLSENAWVFCCFEFPNINSQNQYNTYLKIHDLLNSEHRCLVSSFIMNRITVFFPIFSETPEYNELQQQIKKLYTILSYNIGSGIRGGVSRIYKDKSKLRLSYNEAVESLNKCKTVGELIFASEENENPQIEKNERSDKSGGNNSLEASFTQIINKLLLCDKNGVRTFLELFAGECTSQRLKTNKIKNSFFELLVTANNETKKVSQNFHSENFDNAFSVLSTEDDVKMIKEFTLNFLFECCDAIFAEKKVQENPIIKKVCEYIEENMEHDISLENAADFAGLSSFYLSKLFREEKNETFINFLSNKRLEKSRMLLEETELSIKEIAAETGYNDQNYFSRIFKNKYGVSPKDYRKSK